MHFLASVHFSVQSFHWAGAWGLPPGCHRHGQWLRELLVLSPSSLLCPRWGLAIKQQFCLLRNDVFCLQPPHAACSHTCSIVSKRSVISKLLSPLPGPCRSQLLQIPSQRRLCWISFLPSREIFDRCLLLFHGPVLLCFSSEVQVFCFCSFPITKQ